ncbi:MAG: hypothetical protein CMF34_01930 [Leeuwenhoekiella sp.]|nr:hypothetical protein [Leeuwenhoekiella sp.]MBH13585.1 hypothetical protein [Leeuwenhoekiella sp.]HAX15733.1 hypothetical protein [Leeuwenhoekiella sp.]|tara:strand:+ start:11721 stop:12035 length:315 start_codon:yes stop_codon:yes gene_type:complete
MSQELEAILALKQWNENIVGQLKMITEGKESFKVQGSDGQIIDVPKKHNKGIRMGVTIALEMIEKFPVEINEKPQCPECLSYVDQEELDMFCGFCEDCNENDEE